MEADNPEIFGVAAAAILSDYPADVVAYVSDPRTGVASKSRFVPSISEIKDACESAMGILRAGERKLEIDARRRQQIKDREDWLNAERNPERVARLAAEFKAEVKATRTHNGQKWHADLTKEEAEAKLMQLAIDNKRPYDISATLMQIINRWDIDAKGPQEKDYSF